MADLGNALNQSVKHFNRSLKSFEGRVIVSARRLEELDAKGKKELPELEDIEVRATSPAPFIREAAKGLGRTAASAQQPLLKLAPSPSSSSPAAASANDQD
jgi:DNA anti-recombination protein RmuC